MGDVMDIVNDNTGAPRACGDDPLHDEMMALPTRCSPRMRG